jgi:hypothetical protein
MKHPTVIIFTAISLFACTEQQQSPNYVSPLEFKNYSCKQIAKEMTRTSQLMEQRRQESTAENVIGVAIAAYAVINGYHT